MVKKTQKDCLTIEGEPPEPMKNEEDMDEALLSHRIQFLLYKIMQPVSSGTHTAFNSEVISTLFEPPWSDGSLIADEDD